MDGLLITLQTITVLLLFVEYLSQIIKILKRKTVEDISFTYWGTKISITVLQFVILFISHNPLKVYLSHLLSLIFCLIVFGMINYYHRKNKKAEADNND